MKNFFTTIILLFILLGCSDNNFEPDENIVIEEVGCNLNVVLTRCIIYSCDDPTLMEGIPVFLYPTKEDAAEGTNQIAERISNAEGTAIFSNIDCGEVYIKVVTPENGTFITQEILTENASVNWYEARFVGNYYYDHCDTPSNQRHISLEKPVVGQRSVYKTHSEFGLSSFTPNDYFEDKKLEVTIIDQLSENSFVIQEKADSNVYHFWFDIPDNTVKNIWTFEDNGVTISQFNNEPFYSLVWNLTHEIIPSEEGYHYSFERESSIPLDMKNDTHIFASGPPEHFGTVEDYILCNHRYTDLLYDRKNQTAGDGPFKYRVYNKQDGLVRAIQFNLGGAIQTEGYDLVLE